MFMLFMNTFSFLQPQISLLNTNLTILAIAGILQFYFSRIFYKSFLQSQISLCFQFFQFGKFFFICARSLIELHPFSFGRHLAAAA